MTIDFRSESVRKLFESENKLARKFGNEIARVVSKRMQQMKSCATLAVLRAIPTANCHELTEDKKGKLAIDAQEKSRGKYRIVFVPKNEDSFDERNQIQWDKITSIEILDIENYHKEK